MVGYVVMSKNKSNGFVDAVFVYTDENIARQVVEERNKKYTSRYYYYQKVDIV